MKHKTITIEELNDVLEAHHAWLKDNSQGKQADLSYTVFEDMSLIGLEFNQAILRFAIFINTDCTMTSFIETNLEGSGFTNVKLVGSMFNRADCRNSDFSQSDCESAIFSETNFKHAKFTDVNFFYASFNKASLFHARFENVQFKGADLYETNFTGTRFVNSCLYDAKINNSVFHETIYIVSNQQNQFDIIPIYYIGNVGTFNGQITFIPEHDIIFAGCWKGNFEDFVVKCYEVMEDNEKLKIDRELKGCIAFFESVRHR